jgi:electron transfer flavoprotein beta subunit
MMNIFVCIKQVPDTEAALTVKDGTKINESEIKWIINPYDEYAIEEALKLQEKIDGATVTGVTVGPQRSEDVLRKALAMGVEQAIHVEVEEELDHKTIAGILSNVLKDRAPGVIFMGKQAIDDDAFLTHTYLAEFLNVPVATNVISFNFESDKVTVDRDIDEGDKERIEMAVPCIVAATKGLNEPRYASLMGIMKAKKKPLEKVTLQDININEIKSLVQVEKLYSPMEKPEGKILEGEPEEVVEKLVDLLKNEAQVL